MRRVICTAIATLGLMAAGATASPAVLAHQTPAPMSSSSGVASGAIEAAKGIRMCTAVLAPADAKGCIRDALKRGAAKCRKLHTKRAQYACMRPILRVARML